MWPCGLIANSFFNDTFKVTTGQVMKEDNIAWASDRDKKFINPDAATIANNKTYKFLWETYAGIIPPPSADGSTGGVKDEHFMVWMRTAGLPTFRKLYGRFDTNLKKGENVTFSINTRFPVTAFGGKKALVISTASWMGGWNPFLGIAYVVVGGACLALAAVFFVKHMVSPRALGDTRYLVWKARRH
jgi:hypothetical protein